MDANFETALQTFFAGVEKISNGRPAISRAAVFEMQILRKYARIMRDDSAHCFVDLTNGDVLKPASWKTPAKHARGNIFDAANGLGSMGVFGPAYLR